MVRDYELMYIVRPELDEESLQAATESVEQVITGAGGTVTQSTSWGRRRLAYEVKHLRDGHYMLLQLRLDGAKVANVERALTISETVFRHLLVLQEVPIEPDTSSAESAESAGGNGTAPRQAAVATVPDDDVDQDTDITDDADEDEPTAVAAAPPADAEEDT